MKQVRVIDGLHGEAKGSAVSGIERVDWGWGYGKATVYKLRLADRCVMLQSCLSQVCNDFMLVIHVPSIHAMW